MKCSMPGFPVLHHLLELAQTPVHWVSDAIQPSHLSSPPSPPAFSHSQYSSSFSAFPVNQLFISGGQSIGASASVSVLPMNIRGWFPLELTGLISYYPRDFQECLGTIRNWKEVGMGEKEVSWRNKHTHDNTCPITRNSCSGLLLTSPFAVSFTPHFHSQLFRKQLEAICKTYLYYRRKFNPRLCSK